MIKVEEFFSALVENEVDFFAGVPDSLLKDICSFVTDNTSFEHNIITANEGGAIALGAGYHLATNKIPLIYMQNSGIGNAINPLLSLADKEVYSIPMILLIGWRGEPGVKDEPQHLKQGRVTLSILDSIEIPWQIIDKTSDFRQIISDSVLTARKNSSPVAIIVRKGCFESYRLKYSGENSFDLTREEALEEVLKHIPEKSVIISTTGMLSRELFDLRKKNNQSHETDFLTVGSMGHTSQIALGIAHANPEKTVFCFDGDGSALMHLGNYAIAGSLAPKNLKIIIFNNGAHDSVGGQPTICHWIDLPKIAEAVHLKNFGSIKSTKEIVKFMPLLVKSNHISFININIKKGARNDLGRPTSAPVENKIAFMNFLKKN